jgi:hypothetical protein
VYQKGGNGRGIAEVRRPSPRGLTTICRGTSLLLPNTWYTKADFSTSESLSLLEVLPVFHNTAD